MLKLYRARSGLAGIEFALVLPFLLAMFFGLVDASRAITMARRLTVAAQEVATVASTTAVQATSLSLLSGLAAWQATTAPFALFPQWRAGLANAHFAITLSAVAFTATPSGCTAACNYTGKIAWSIANPAGQATLRSCGTVTPVADASAPSLTTLPSDTFGPTSLLVADVSATFQPLFTSVFVGPFTLLRSAYISPRLGNGISLSSAFPGPNVTCS